MLLKWGALKMRGFKIMRGIKNVKSWCQIMRGLKKWGILKMLKKKKWGVLKLWGVLKMQRADPSCQIMTGLKMRGLKMPKKWGAIKMRGLKKMLYWRAKNRKTGRSPPVLGTGHKYFVFWVPLGINCFEMRRRIKIWRRVLLHNGVILLWETATLAFYI